MFFDKRIRGKHIVMGNETFVEAFIRTFEDIPGRVNDRLCLASARSRIIWLVEKERWSKPKLVP